MRVFFDDDDLDGQFQRTLAHAYERAADLGEAFAVARRITPADDQSWYRQWSAAAQAARRSAQDSRDGGHGASAGEAFLRACEYFRQAMFYLRGDLDDPRVIGTYRCMRECFRQAAQLLPWDITAVDIPFQGSTLNGYLMAPPGPAAPRPAVLFPAGYDSPAEEGYLYAAPALRRGYVVLSFEGPGQGGVLYEQRLYLRPDFEAVLAPVVDFALGRPEIDPARLAVIGRSFAGYLAPRAAAAEHRIAALVCDPAQPDLGARVRDRLPASVLQLIEADDPRADQILAPMLNAPGARRTWLPRMAAHGTATLRGYVRALSDFTLAGRAAQIRCPTLITEAEGDFAAGGSRRMYDLLTCPKQYRQFTEAEGAGGHIEGLAQQLWNGYVFDWLDATLKRD
ncbi:MAG TPA: alpha/beta hydrolase [Streptosporangiaceae bacterium]|nr:alpha/beta hydrolase [Streptosporangiaceae bacterium]